MKTAIVGLPQVGKTALFKILTGAAGEGRIGATKVQLGSAKVPDKRLDALTEIFQPPKSVQAVVEYADMPALSREALRKPSYIADLRNADAFTHVLRAFEEATVMHAAGSLDPRRDWENIEAELMLNDLQVVENRLERVEKDIKRVKNPELAAERALLIQCRNALEEEQPLREAAFTAEEAKLLKGFQFLSAKPMLLVVNAGEEQAAELAAVERRYREALLPGRKNLGVTAVCGSIEAELAELDAAEARDYLDSYGLAESGRERIVQAAYELLGLMSFLTAGEKECRAWTVPKNSTAVQAAGAIHGDFAKRFIRAEVIGWEKLAAHGGYAAARAAGDLRLEGKQYIVQDGDVLVIRHG